MDTSNLILIVLLQFFASQHVGAQGKDGFVFTMANTLRYGSTSQFCLTLHGSNKVSEQITMVFTDKSGQNTTEVQDFFPFGKQKCKKFSVPKPGDYVLHLSNETGAMHDSVAVTVLGDKLITLVQTDKPIYKPGQTVKFRVLTLMSDLKPRIGQIKSILIVDPNDIRVKQYLNVETKGISSLEFQLAAATKLGTWKIEILVDDVDEESNTITSGEFVVDEYVLPRFEVEIIPPTYVLANQKSITVQVCAKYTYGKNVTGFLDLDVCWKSSFMPPRSCSKELVKITGCHSFITNFTRTTGKRYDYYSSELQIKASVTEAGTGVTVNKTHDGPSLSYEPLSIQLDDYSNGYFKPGLPFYGKVIVTKPNGTPAEGELITITATDTRNELKFAKNFTTDSYGLIVYSLCSSFTEMSKSISIHAEANQYAPSDEGLHTPRGYRHIKQWFSPSLSYIQIPRTDSSHKCGDRLTLSIPFTTRPNTNIEFNYQVMTQGKVIKTGQISYDQATSYPGRDLILPPSDICLNENDHTPSPPTTTENSVTEDAVEENPESKDVEPPSEGSESVKTEKLTTDDEIPYSPWQYNPFEEPIVRSEHVSDIVSNFLLDLPIMPNMSPKFTLLVYHILQDGEVVADSMQFLVDPCFENQVKMEFNQTTVLPGEAVDINLKAAPGSVCGVGIIDKSVNILGGNHQITPKLVFQKMEEFNSVKRAYYSSSFSIDPYCEKRIRNLQGEEGGLFSYTSPFVDAMTAFKASGFLVLSNLNLETRPCATDHIVMYAMVPGPDARIEPIPLTSEIPMSQNKIRSNFPETWLWDLHIIGETGVTVLKETAPHTITSWVGNAMCLDQDKGFGISKLTSLTTFQPFFLSLQLPYAAVRGERLPIMFTVYNYLEKCLHIQLTLTLGNNFKTHGKLDQVPICVCGGDSYTTKFHATPTAIGSLTVLAQAEIVPGVCGNTMDVDTTHVGLSDSVKRQLLVKAEGVEQQYTHTSFICPKADEPIQETFVLPLPAEGEMVADSARGNMMVIGDIMGPALTNLNNLVRMPSGCGEQNMIGFVPNIVVLKYLTSIGKIKKEIQENAVKFMEIGYQKELTYRHKDGSYSAFGESDPKGSVWLTSFVVKSYAQARPYIYIDEKDLTLSLKFLRHSQLETGCFRETGKVFQSYMMGGLSTKKDTESNTALTAYVLTALLSANVSISEPVIVGAIDCINEDFQSKKEKMDPYTLALVAYANSLHKPNSRIGHEVLSVLDSKAHKNGSLKYWSRETPVPKPLNSWYYYAASSAEVEMTAYALMANINLFGKRAIERTHNVAMWLSQQRSPSGGFSSTQDTVIGLQALSEFASLSYTKEGTEMQILVSGKDLHEDISVSENEGTTLLLQTVPIPVLPNEITVNARGVGCALVQASVTYNKQPKDMQGDEKPSFHLRVNVKKYAQNINECNKATISISVGKKGSSELNNGMSLVTVKMVTSWTPISQSLTKLKGIFPLYGIKRFEYNEEQAVLTFYFDELSKRPKEFSFDVEQDKDLAVSSPKPAEVKIFQYYEPDVLVFETYKLRTICGTKEEIPYTISSNVPGEIDQQRVDLSLSPAVGKSTSDVCPVCIPIKHQPRNLKEMVCTSTAIYKAIAGRKGAYPLKLIQNLQSEKKDKLKIFANYKMEAGCDCTILEQAGKRVLIFVSQEVSSDKMLNLNSSSLVIVTDKDIEKQVRKFKKSCSIKS